MWRVDFRAVLLCLSVSACGGESDADDPADAGESDAAAPFTIGDICRLLAPATCERDAECFQSLPPPCEASLMERCCGEAGTCDQVNGVTPDRVEECISAIYEATCPELEELPAPCERIAAPGGPVTGRRQLGAQGAANWFEPLMD